ncbi:unnamed protein product [Adineta ricciae]|uniref:Uncharacterized protein n=1 Tax=Adineta ricciae TaxID=249248 RepID=A0A815WLT7_ADIRI|nr:unnamed protein product [Adineta ricciae]
MCEPILTPTYTEPMYKQTGLYLTILIVIMFYLVNSFSATPINMLKQDQKRSFALFFRRLGIGSDYLLSNPPMNGHYNEENVISSNRAGTQKKRARFFQQSHSPYSIAFPALIRSR